SMKASGREISSLDLAIHNQVRSGGPGRNPELKGKADRCGRVKLEPDISSERVDGVLRDGDPRLPAHHRMDHAWAIRDGCQPLVRGRHPEISRELGPPLVHICRAASEVRLQP